MTRFLRAIAPNTLPRTCFLVALPLLAEYVLFWGLTWEMVIIGAVRVAGSLPVLRWALAGAIIAVLTDLSDLFLWNLIDLGGLGSYQRFDKYLDQVYLLTFLLVSRRWERTPRVVALVLYVWRFVGFVAYELTGARGVLPFFPNVFEFWFLFVAAQRHWWPAFAYTRPAVIRWGAVLLVLKLAHEYVLHWGRWLDSFTALEAVEAIWSFVSAPFR
jgi:hypothetical protein